MNTDKCEDQGRADIGHFIDCVKVQRAEKSLQNDKSQHWRLLIKEIIKNKAHPYRLVVCVTLDCPVWSSDITLKMIQSSFQHDFILKFLDDKADKISFNRSKLHDLQVNNSMENSTLAKTAKPETDETHTKTKEESEITDLMKHFSSDDEDTSVHLRNEPIKVCKEKLSNEIDRANLVHESIVEDRSPVNVGPSTTGDSNSESGADIGTAPSNLGEINVEHNLLEMQTHVDNHEKLKKLKARKITDGKILVPESDDEGIPEIREFIHPARREITAPKVSTVNMLHGTPLLSTSDPGSTRRRLEADGHTAVTESSTSVVSQVLTQNPGVTGSTATVTQAPVVETDGSSGAIQNTSAVTQQMTQRLESVVETDGNAGTEQNDTLVVTQAMAHRSQSIVETDGNSGTAHNNTSVVAQATTQSNETDGNPTVSDNGTSVVTQATSQTLSTTASDTQVPEESDIDKVLKRIARGEQVGPRITMKFELLRVCTLRNYPKENKPSIIRLAAAGFYYAAERDEVICYCCGVRKRDWSANSNPMAIHRRLSPRCSFLINNAAVNIGVPRDTAAGEGRDRFANLRELLEERPGDEAGTDTTLAARGLSDSMPRNSSTGSRIGNSEEQLKCVFKILIFYFSINPYDVTIHSNRLDETIRMNAHIIGFN